MLLGLGRSFWPCLRKFVLEEVFGDMLRIYFEGGLGDMSPGSVFGHVCLGGGRVVVGIFA